MFLVKNVKMRATDELYHTTFREFRKAIVQTGVVPTDCNDTHVPDCILGPAFAQKTGFLRLLAQFKKSLEV